MSFDTQLVQSVHDIISNLDGAVNCGHKTDRFDHNVYLQRPSTQEDIAQIRLLWDKRVHSQVDQFSALWVHASSLRSSSSVIWCVPAVGLRYYPVPYLYK